MVEAVPEPSHAVMAVTTLYPSWIDILRFGRLNLPQHTSPSSTIADLEPSILYRALQYCPGYVS
jgi:hypothetical protein